MKEFNRDILRNFIKNCKNFCILCLGNTLRGDDGIAIKIGERLKEKFDVFISELDPTAYLFKIKKDYDGVIIIDCCDAKRNPGEILIIEEDDLADNLFTTHDINLKFILEFLKDKKILIIGIQGKNFKIGDKVSKEVEKAGGKLAKILTDISTNSY